MGFPVDPSMPNAPTGTATGTMIPEIWSGLLLVKFYEATPLTDIANTDYEGDIKDQGDVVHIRLTPDITITDHLKGQKLVHQDPEVTVVDLEIDKGKSWAYRATEVDLAQADYDFVSDWTNDASNQMRVTIDYDVWNSIYADADADNKGLTAGKYSHNYNLGTTAAPVVVTPDTITGHIVNMGSTLDEQSIPEEDRWLLMPAWMCGMIKQSELKGANLTGDAVSILRNGRIGMIDRFTIYRSNQLYVDTGKTSVLFGHKSALTFASQLIKNEGPIKHPDYFGDYYRGLQVFGYNVNKPDAMGEFVAAPA